MPATDTAGWMTAIGTLFAAVGTVGAVLIALWQTVWRERSDLKTHTYYRPDDDAPGGGILYLTADNPRQTPVNVPAAGLSTQSKVNLPAAGHSSLPKKLGHKDSARAHWHASELRKLEQAEGPIYFGTFMSEVDGAFRAPMPGGKKKRFPKLRRGTGGNREFKPPEHPPWRE